MIAPATSAWPVASVSPGVQSPPRRVLIVHSGSDLYGSDLVCLRTARGVRAAGWHVEVMLPRMGDLAAALRELDVHTHVLDPLVLRRSELRGGGAVRVPWRWAREARSLRRFADRHHFDLVHSNTAVTLGGLLLARRWKAAHVWHVHEIFWHNPLLVSALGWLLGRSDVIVGPSRAVVAQFSGRVPSRRTRIVPSGVEVPDTVSGSVPLERRVPRIVTVGRLNSMKGQDVLVDAAHRLVTGGQAVEVQLVGDVYGAETSHRQRLEAQINRLGLQEHVHLLGERRDALQLVAQGDIFVLPSRRPESFGMALVEAMALGRPVVASAAGGPREVVTHGVDGLLVPPGSGAALAAAIQSLVRDPFWAQQLGEQAAKRAAALTSDVMVAGILDAYEAAMSLHSRAPARSEAVHIGGSGPRESAVEGGPASVAILVATAGRPAGLRRLLASVVADVGDYAGTVRVVIVDNDPAGGAPVDVDELKEVSGSVPVEVHREARRGIPYARNRAVAEVIDAVDVIIFVDDDEEVLPGWLAAHLWALEAYGADVTVGPVQPVLGPTAPAWARDGRLHETFRAPSGTPLSTAPTGNTAVRASALHPAGSWFDPTLATTGGSDTELFGRLAEQGFRIVWVEEPCVVEHVPEERQRLKWILRRAYRTGCIESLLLRRNHSLVSTMSARRAGRGMALVLVGATQSTALLVFRRQAAYRGLRRMARGLGAIAGLLGLSVRQYR